MKTGIICSIVLTALAIWFGWTIASGANAMIQDHNTVQAITIAEATK